MSIDITPRGNGRFQLTGAGNRLAYAVIDGARAWVYLDGRVHVIGDRPAFTSTRQSSNDADAMALAAPMPATVVEIKVAPGDRVSRGDVLITLEAMKMELPITAPRDGTVKSVACRAGELVQPGVALLELE